WYAADVFLLAFAGILLAVFLDFLAGRLAEAAHLRRGWAFAIVAVGISLLLALAAWEAIPRVADQVSQLIHSLPAAFERLRSYLQGREWGRTLLGYLPSALASANLTGKLTGLLSRAFDGVAGLVIIAVVGLYLGANPDLYRRGLLKLFSDQRRERASYVFTEVAYTLRWWVLGQLIPMGVLGIATTIGLWLLHVPLAFTLGLFTAFMIFIPYIGSLIALAVTLLVVLIQGPTEVLYVTLLFIGVHSAEGYLLTPMVQRRAVYLPPALTILSQVIMGVLLGFLGLALATPLTAAILTLVTTLYLREAPRHHG
ncbi:MAG TPA: AI-2E family transporter, partial [Bryobacteraceae bacterium]|nr:AI-2E family transporter [Bryobacteraceae bacterium]